MKSTLMVALILSLGIGSTRAQTFKEMRFDHLAIYVTNLQQSGKFYQGILGLDSIPEPFHDGKHLWLSLGSGTSLHIIQGAEKPKEYFQNNHLCLRTDNVVAFTKVLEANKIGYVDLKGTPGKINTRPDGIQQVWLKDPDGYWIEVNNAK